MDSYAQISFGGYLNIVMLPDTEILCQRSEKNESDSAIYSGFRLVSGKAGFYIDLPSNSYFNLSLQSGAYLNASKEGKTAFLASSAGAVWFFSGSAYFYSTGGRQFPAPEFKGNLTAGIDESGNQITYAALHYNRQYVTGIASNFRGGRLGVDTSGNFTASGNPEAVLFRITSEDYFFFYGNDAKGAISINISRLSKGVFNLSYRLYNPGLRGFTFSDMDAPAGSPLFFRFQMGKAYVYSHGQNTYDLKIVYSDKTTIGRFYLNTMPLYEGSGHLFTVLNYVQISNPYVNSVEFGLDEDGDGTPEKTARIHTDMTGKQVYDQMESGKQGMSLFSVFLMGVAILGIIVLMVFALRRGESGAFPDEEPALREMEVTSTIETGEWMGHPTGEKKADMVEAEEIGVAREERPAGATEEVSMPPKREENDVRLLSEKPETPLGEEVGEGVAEEPAPSKEGEGKEEGEDEESEGESEEDTLRPSGENFEIEPPTASEYSSSSVSGNLPEREIIAGELIQAAREKVIDEEYEPIGEEEGLLDEDEIEEIEDEVHEVPGEPETQMVLTEEMPEEEPYPAPELEMPEKESYPTPELEESAKSEFEKESEMEALDEVELSRRSVEELKKELDDIRLEIDDDWWTNWNEHVRTDIERIRADTGKIGD